MMHFTVITKFAYKIVNKVSRDTIIQYNVMLLDSLISIYELTYI